MNRRRFFHAAALTKRHRWKSEHDACLADSKRFVTQTIHTERMFGYIDSGSDRHSQDGVDLFRHHAARACVYCKPSRPFKTSGAAVSSSQSGDQGSDAAAGFSLLQLRLKCHRRVQSVFTIPDILRPKNSHTSDTRGAYVFPHSQYSRDLHRSCFSDIRGG